MGTSDPDATCSLADRLGAAAGAVIA